VDTGKAVARTNKALVRSGSCQWSEAISESVHFLQDDASKELEEKLFKFVVSMVGFLYFFLRILYGLFSDCLIF
jgi:hypothetical protein